MLKEKQHQVKFDNQTMNEIINEGKSLPKRNGLFKNLWYEGEMCVLFGETNSGKSIYAVQIANEIAQRGIKVIYFDYELDSRQISSRYTNEDSSTTFHFSDNIIRPDLTYDKNTTFKERTNKLKKRMLNAAMNGVNVFIIDNISCLNPNLSKANEATKFILDMKNTKDSLGASILLLGHSPKRKGHGLITIDDLAGSKNIANFIDSCFCIGKAKDKVYIKQLKSRNSAITLNEDHVLVCSVEKDDNGFLHFEELYYEREKAILSCNSDDFKEKEQAYNLYKQLKSYRKVAQVIGISDKTAKKWIEEYATFYADSDNTESEELRNVGQDMHDTEF